jgi:hypothetical protein
MTNLAFPPLPVSVDEDEMLGQEITLLAGQINARLPPEAGSLVVKAIEAVANPVQEEKQQELKNREKDVSAETFSEAVAREAPNQYREILEHTRADDLFDCPQWRIGMDAKSDDFDKRGSSLYCIDELHL